ncbi:hypothetical protein IC582_003681 [Cucumis melo]|nr:polygalacturonase-like [Cucumis melo]
MTIIQLDNNHSLLLFIFLVGLSNWSIFVETSSYNVVNFGGKGDGTTDSTQAFQMAWANACASTEKVTIYVPRGRYYIKNVTFSGPCNNKGIIFRIDGTLEAPSDFVVIGNSEAWILFRHVDGITILGGNLDGHGAALWACKNSSYNTLCPTGATTLEFSNSKNVVINNLKSLNSQMFHITINGCKNVIIKGLRVSASSNSPNTDGIHVQSSSNVTIINSKIGTGDDCISVGPGISNLQIENISCGPGHGISIGSLGKDVTEIGVQNVTVKNVVFSRTKNGVRIKTWGKPSNGFATNIIFQHIVMNNVHNPIVIDQNYCPTHKACPGKASGIKISNVTYQDIHGTSTTTVAIMFDCSPTNPCIGIKLENISLTYKNQTTEARCYNARGVVVGQVQPTACF